MRYPLAENGRCGESRGGGGGGGGGVVVVVMGGGGGVLSLDWKGPNHYVISKTIEGYSSPLW